MMSILPTTMFLVATLVVLYKLNSHLVYYQVEDQRDWSITYKISTVVKYMVMGGIMALLPGFYMATLGSNANPLDYKE